VGVVHCWGDDSAGQSTVPDTLDRVSTQHVSAGAAHTCALSESEDLHCWGDLEAMSGWAYRSGPFTDLTTGSDHTCALEGDGGAVRCWGDNTFGQSNEPKGSFLAIEAGGWHTCGLLAEEGDPELGYEVQCWGADAHNQTSGAPSYRFLSLHTGLEHTCGHKPDGLMACWGRNLEGQLK